MLKKIVTIGVYGFDPAEFVDRLKAAGVDTFCDVRGRRSVRGSAYSFANSRRLQASLAELGIRYFHFPELAPKRELRTVQAAVDKRARIAKRQRAELSPEFIAGYREQCLERFNATEFVQRIGPEARAVVLFCVEREPAACHRGLLAEKLAHELGWAVEHLQPTP